MRRVGWFILGGVALVSLAGCKPTWFEAREPWRAEAEQQCLKSGAVKGSAAVALLRPIQGPGVCGADFPLKVAALGDPWDQVLAKPKDSPERKAAEDVVTTLQALGTGLKDVGSKLGVLVLIPTE